MARRAEQVNDQVWCRSRDRITAVEVQVNDRLDDQVGCLAWDLVRSETRSQVMNEVMNQVWDRVWRRVWDQAVEDTDGSKSRA